jgi:hypothetical protein
MAAARRNATATAALDLMAWSFLQLLIQSRICRARSGGRRARAADFKAVEDRAIDATVQLQDKAGLDICPNCRPAPQDAITRNT